MFEIEDPCVLEQQISPDNERTNQSEDQAETENVMPDVDNTLLTPETTGSDTSSAPWRSSRLTRKPRWLEDYVPSR